MDPDRYPVPDIDMTTRISETSAVSAASSRSDKTVRSSLRSANHPNLDSAKAEIDALRDENRRLQELVEKLQDQSSLSSPPMSPAVSGRTTISLLSDSTSRESASLNPLSSTNEADIAQRTSSPLSLLSIQVETCFLDKLPKELRISPHDHPVAILTAEISPGSVVCRVAKTYRQLQSFDKSLRKLLHRRPKGIRLPIFPGEDLYQPTGHYGVTPVQVDVRTDMLSAYFRALSKLGIHLASINQLQICSSLQQSFQRLLSTDQVKLPPFITGGGLCSFFLQLGRDGVWKSRYLVVNGPLLNIFDSPCGALMARINMTENVSVRINLYEFDATVADERWSFSIHDSRLREWRFSCESERKLEIWVNALFNLTLHQDNIGSANPKDNCPPPYIVISKAEYHSLAVNGGVEPGNSKPPLFRRSSISKILPKKDVPEITISTPFHQRSISQNLSKYQSDNFDLDFGVTPRSDQPSVPYQSNGHRDHRAERFERKSLGPRNDIQDEFDGLNSSELHPRNGEEATTDCTPPLAVVNAGRKSSLSPSNSFQRVGTMISVQQSTLAYYIPPPPTYQKNHIVSSQSAPMIEPSEEKHETRAHSSRRLSLRRSSTLQPITPVFGAALSHVTMVCSYNGHNVPSVVARCVDFLVKNNASNEEGIFRINGAESMLSVLERDFDMYGDVDLFAVSKLDVHTVATLLKRYLRKLPKPLFGEWAVGQAHRVTDLHESERIQLLQSKVKLMATPEYDVLFIMIQFLRKVVYDQSTKRNRMDLRNISIVFSPTLRLPQSFISTFINSFDTIFNASS